jgi:hypothetical protein
VDVGSDGWSPASSLPSGWENRTTTRSSGTADKYYSKSSNNSGEEILQGEEQRKKVPRALRSLVDFTSPGRNDMSQNSFLGAVEPPKTPADLCQDFDSEETEKQITVPNDVPRVKAKRPVSRSNKTAQQQSKTKSKRKSTPQFVFWDLTIPATDERYPNWKSVGKMLDGVSKKWVFQQEKTEDGYLHWQVRLSLIKRSTRHNALRVLAPEYGGNWPPGSDGARKGSGKTFSYVMKDDTRDKNRNCPSHLPDMELYTATQHRGVILTIES